MLLAVDVHYQANRTHVAGVAFERWSSSRPQAVYCSAVKKAQAYVSGEFYKRELPGILALIHDYDLLPGTIIIDGHVYLDGVSQPGLGKHLYDALNGRARIVGVAKNAFSGIGSHHAILRGNSSRPLYVTAAGMALSRARECILRMHGRHRMPTLLKIADRECRRPSSGGSGKGECSSERCTCLTSLVSSQALYPFLSHESDRPGEYILGGKPSWMSKYQGFRIKLGSHLRHKTMFSRSKRTA